VVQVEVGVVRLLENQFGAFLFALDEGSFTELLVAAAVFVLPEVKGVRWLLSECFFLAETKIESVEQPLPNFDGRGCSVAKTSKSDFSSSFRMENVLLQKKDVS